MRNYASRRTSKKGATRFRTPSLYKANKSAFGQHFKHDVRKAVNPRYQSG